MRWKDSPTGSEEGENFISAESPEVRGKWEGTKQIEKHSIPGKTTGAEPGGMGIQRKENRSVLLERICSRK